MNREKNHDLRLCDEILRVRGLRAPPLPVRHSAECKGGSHQSRFPLVLSIRTFQSRVLVLHVTESNADPVAYLCHILIQLGESVST
jgi:hypothetical protein